MARRQKKIPAAKKKRTLILSAETFQRLGVEADRQGKRRSAVADKILGDHLRHIVVTFRSREEMEAEKVA
jgi:hypothetical protein